MSKEDKIEVGNILINNDYDGGYYKKQILIDYNGPYLSMNHFDKIRISIQKILKKYGNKNDTPNI